MSHPIDTSPTDLGDGQRAKPHDMSTGLPRIDVHDRDQVFDLSVQLMTGDRRRLMQTTLEEWRAVARLAAMSAPIFTRAIDIAEKMKPGEPATVVEGEVLKMVQLTRALMDAERQPAKAKEIVTHG